MIEEGAAAGLVVERPAHGVLHETRPVLLGRHLPQLLQPDAEFLRADSRHRARACGSACLESEPRAPSANRVYLPRMRDAGRVAVLVAAVARDTHVAGDHAFDLAVRAEDHIDDGETRIDFHAERFRLLGEPAA